MADEKETPAGGHAHGGASHSHDVKREDTHGARTLEELSHISQTKQDEKVKRSLELGLEAAEFNRRPQHLAVLARSSAGLRRHQHFHEGSLLRGYSQGWRL